MLLTIHNLPADIRYPEIKTLLLSKCGLQNVILDNLTSEGNTKKVTVGVAEEEDAAFLVRKINGLYLNGQQLYVEDVRQKKSASEQPFRTMNPQSQQNVGEGYHNMPGKGMGAGMGNMMSPVQPLMAMYYMPAEYAQQAQGYGAESWGMMGNQGYMQNQNYAMAQNVQNPYMSDEAPQAQASNFGTNQFTKTQDYPDKKYDEDSSAMFARRSNEPKWQTNDGRRASPARDREQGHEWQSRDSRDSWQSRGDGGRGPRPEDPPGPRRPPPQPKKNDRAFNRPDFEKRNEFSGRNDLSEPFRNDRPGFGRNERSDGDRDRPDFGRPANRQDSERPNYRPDFGRPNVRPEFGQSSRQQFGRPSKPEFPNKPEFRPNKPEFRPNKPEFRPNKPEFRPNKPDFRGNNPDFRPNKPEFGSGRGGRFDRGGSRPMTEPRKRRFDEALPIEAYVERPERLSRPDNRPLPVPPKSKLQRNELDDFSNLNLANLTPKQLKAMKYTAYNNIMFDMIHNLKLGFPDMITKQEMKKIIKERFEVILETKAMVAPKDAVALYRSKYSRASDKDAYNKILAAIAAIKAEEAAETAGIQAVAKPAGNPASVSSAGNTAPATSTSASAVKPPLLPNPVAKPLPPLQTMGIYPATSKPGKKKRLIPMQPGQKIPSFPGGDKSVVAAHKKMEKEGLVPFVPLYYEHIIEEELNDITKLLIDELENSENETQQRAYDMAKDSDLVDDFKKILHHHLARRISNEGLKVIRITGRPRLPRRPELEDFLLHYGVISLRKSEKSKMYTAAVETYDDYDTLCNMEPIAMGIEGTMVSFKPLNLTPKPRADQKVLKKERGKLLQSMIDRSGVNLLDKNWPAQDEAYKEKMAAEALIQEQRLTEIRDKFKAALREREIAAALKREKKKEMAAAKEKEMAEAKEKEMAGAKEKEANANENEADAKDNDDSKEKEIVETTDKETTEAPAEAPVESENAVETIPEVAENTPANDDAANDMEALDSTAGDTNNDFLHEDYEVIDEVNETDSDVEYVADNNPIVNLDDDEHNDADNVVNDDHYDPDETLAEDCDDAEMDIDNVNEDDLEDY